MRSLDEICCVHYLISPPFLSSMFCYSYHWFWHLFRFRVFGEASLAGSLIRVHGNLRGRRRGVGRWQTAGFTVDDPNRGRR